MTLKAQMETDLDVFFNTDEFAVSVTYTPVGQAGGPINAIVYYGPEDAERAMYTVDVITVRVKASDIALLSTYGRPVYRDKITVAMPGSGTNEDWYVDRISLGNGYVWRLVCIQAEKPAFRR